MSNPPYHDPRSKSRAFLPPDPKAQEPYRNRPFDITIEQMEPERLFSFRWHPFAVEPGVDYSAEPTTLVEFRLEDIPDGTLLTVVESGFDAIPVARRAEAYRRNDGGWAAQLKKIEQHVAA